MSLCQVYASAVSAGAAIGADTGALPDAAIHGVNLSLGYDFNPRWFGCGQSPVCVEVDRLVLAAVGEADALVSGDGDIQALKAQFHIPIFTVAEFADWLQAH